MDMLAEKYDGQAVFLLVYGREAHPEGSPYPDPFRPYRKPLKEAATYAERVASAQFLQKQAGVERRMLVDELGGLSMRERFLPGPRIDNPVFVVGTDGRIAFAMKGAKARALDGFLKTYLAGGNNAFDGNDRPPVAN
jgi:hypothetical protein